MALRKTPFIKPMVPALAKVPPTASDWLREVKFDDCRMQLHVEGEQAGLYSKNGTDFTQRFRALKFTLVNIRADSAVIGSSSLPCDENRS